MAAVLPHLAQDDESSEQERAYWRCDTDTGLSGPEFCPAPQEIVNGAHAELLNIAWIREALISKMNGHEIWIDYDKEEPLIVIDKALRGPAWNPSGGAKRTTILGWTTKMGAPSFSLPAGAKAIGGACPGATAGQTTSPPQARKNQAKLLLPVLNRGGKFPVVSQVRSARAICEFCYAEGGQYAISGVQQAQLMRYAWAQRAIKRPGHLPGVSEFYSVMLDAIDNVDFQLGKEGPYPGKRFFRLHDSGDFFTPRYLTEWKKITLYYHPLFGGEDLQFEDSEEVVVRRPGSGHPHPIWFWAPTRIWAEGQKRIEFVSRINGIRINGKETWDNFAIRPSVYHINEHGPSIDLPGWAAPTTVYDKEAQQTAISYDWNCLAYDVEKGPSCRGAKSDPEGPGKGKEGCRECWLRPQKAVNYTLHL